MSNTGGGSSFRIFRRSPEPSRRNGCRFLFRFIILLGSITAFHALVHRINGWVHGIAEAETSYRLQPVANLENVMNNFRAKFQHLPWLVHGELRLQIPSDPEHVQPVAAYLSELAVVTARCDPKREPHIIVALSEALTNAIVHGNLEISSELRDSEREEEYFQQIQLRKKIEPFCTRIVEICVEFLEEGISWTITDEGGGFDVESIPDPTDPENLLRSSGRGLLMMNAFSDELTFNEKGNQVRMFVQAPNHRPTPTSST